MAEEQTMARSRASITLGPQGRVVLPAPFRKALDLSTGEHLLVRLEADHLVIEKTAAVERRIHQRFRKAKGRSLADELIEERRNETASLENHA